MSSEYANACRSPDDRAHADAAIDRERAGLDDALLEAPALEARLLEVEVGEIDVVLVDRREHAIELRPVEVAGGEEQALGVGE